MERRWLFIDVISVLCCGFALRISYEASGGASWSILTGSIDHSPWEIMKPFAIVFIGWSFVEMSLCRPSLLRYVCGRVLALHLFVVSSLLLLPLFPEAEAAEYIVIVLSLTAAGIFQMIAYNRGWRTDLFFVPIIISFAVLFFFLLFYTVRIMGK